MKTMLKGQYIHVLPQGEMINYDMLMGWRQKRGDPWLIVENNIVNRIVLGLPALPECQNVKAECPENFKPYQVADVTKTLGLKHYLNANPMGLGKTAETVVMMRNCHVNNVLIVTPKIIRYQWQQQLKEWGDFESTIYENQVYVDGGIWIINYDKLRNEKTRLKFKRFQWDLLVLDEAHRIKNRNSAQSKAVKDLPAARRVALTGTPILRYVDDLWSILNFLDQSYSGISYWTFVNYFCATQESPWGNKITGLTCNPAKIAILNQLINLVAIRNSVEVAFGKTHETVKLPMSKAQRELYRKEKALLLDQLPSNCTIANGAVLTTRLMQTTSWPGLFIPGENGPKFEWILETCQNNSTDKFVIFSVFEQTVRALEAYLNGNNVGAVSITGKKKDTENEAAKRAFVDGNVQVLIGTIKAMGQGYDELQKVCRLMICIDRDWSPEIMEQAEDRLRRMGQDNPVTIWYLECQGSFDQYVSRINITKAEDIREALGGDTV